jgi:peptidoglycan hydrolase CwlO-like protein
MVDAAREKEERSKGIIHNLQLELAQLGKIVEQGAGMSVNQDNTINELMATREELLKEREAQQARLEQLRSENKDIQEKVTKSENELMLLESEVKNYKDSIAQHNNDADREDRRKKRLYGELQ